MSNTLQEAIAAARAGDMARAQMLAADVVSDTPDDPNGWYLLSQLVESDARRAAYLSKTLALDPNHPRARAEFAALPPALVADLSPVADWSPVAMPEPIVPERRHRKLSWRMRSWHRSSGLMLRLPRPKFRLRDPTTCCPRRKR